MEGTSPNPTASPSQEPRRTIANVREEIEKSKGQYIWQDYVRALRVISEVIFTKSAGFILEFIQNAEDAGVGLLVPGEVRICINKQRIKITHNGRPFTEENVRALCSIRSSKKPEQGTLGYLGIGFKSVFKITDSPEIYSGSFTFKFDRSAHLEPQDTPWQVLPIWLLKPSEKIDHQMTTFVLPLREESDYERVETELGQLRIGLYLFLRWITRIVVENDVLRTTWTLESVEDDQDDVKTLRRGAERQRFRFFRRTCRVPEGLKADRLVQEFRPNVLQREVVIAFALDEEDNIVPKLAGTMYGGVYSFLPLAEATSGATFAIQTDFLVQPGREAIAHEAAWNHWLIEQVYELAKEIIGFFKSHPRWKYQFLPAFEFKKEEGDEGYERFFYPKLIKPLEEFITNGSCVLTTDGDWVNFSQVVKLVESPDAADDWVKMGILSREETASTLGCRPGLQFVDPQVAERATTPFRRVDRRSLLENRPFLQSKAKQADAAEWFRSLYRWLQKHPRYPQPHLLQHERYFENEFVLTEDCRLMKGGDVSLPDLAKPDTFLAEFADLLGGTKSILHPGILQGLSDEERAKVRGFLLGYTGVQSLDSRRVCREAVLPRLLTTADKPTPEELMKLTRICQQVLDGDLGTGGTIWVLDKHHVVRPAREVVFSRAYAPSTDWETNQLYVPTWSFLSTEYLPIDASGPALVAWCEFFRAGGVKVELADGVEVFAVNFAKQKLSPSYDLSSVESHNLGYDLVGIDRQTQRKIYIEVKGRRDETDIELTGNETQAANTWRDSYYLCVVANIPWAPAAYFVPDPATRGNQEKLTVPTKNWKSFPIEPFSRPAP